MGHEVLKGRHVRRHAFQNEIDFAGQHPAFPDQRLVADEFLKAAQIGLGLAGKMHRGKHGDIETEPPRIEQTAIALDVTFFFQGPHPSQTGRRRNSDSFGQLDIGDPAVGLNFTENLQVNIVKILGHARAVPSQPIEANRTLLAQLWRVRNFISQTVHRNQS